MEKMEIYNQVRNVPVEAQKAINGGRLKGKTDINPMWRIKTLTELFGPCGEGWGYSRPEFTVINCENGEKIVECYLELWYQNIDKRIPGIGGSMLVAREKDGLFNDDEAYKKAMTDALSVACKALGVGADIYWQADATKYTTHAPASKSQPKTQPKAEPADKRHDFPEGAEDNPKLMEWLAKRQAEGCNLVAELRAAYKITDAQVEAVIVNFNAYIINKDRD